MITRCRPLSGQQQFDQLVERSRRRAYSLAYRITKNVSDAEDVTQDAYLRAWQHFDHFEASRSFEAWLFTIITRRAIDVLRRKKQTRFDTVDLSRRSEIADPAADPHEEVSILLLEERVESAVAALPARYRDTIRLYYAEECSYQEIAERMGCAEGTVRSRIHRARAMLRLHVATGADMSPRT